MGTYNFVGVSSNIERVVGRVASAVGNDESNVTSTSASFTVTSSLISCVVEGEIRYSTTKGRE